jgi:ketosteroid isomerase-like protein
VRENEAVVRKLYDLFANPTDDTTKVMDLYSDDIAWHAPAGETIVMGHHKGKQAMVEALTYQSGLVTDFQIELLRLFADDEEVVSVHRDLATRTDGAKLDVEVCCRWKVRGGQIVELWEYSNDPRETDDFFAGK